MTTSRELYELFLALAPTRLQAARVALESTDVGERRDALAASLVPLAVDAVLLGADGLANLARATVDAAGIPKAALERTIDILDASAEALGSGDASGARVDEARLKREAAELWALARGRAEPAPTPAIREAGDGADANDREWIPDLAEDMVGAFLDECGERIDALADRLIELEERRDDPELVSAVFRDLHTLKGSSAFAGLARMNRVAHAAEDLVAEIRSGKRAADRPVVDALLAGLEALRAILERAQRRVPIDVDTEPVLRLLRDPASVAGAALHEVAAQAAASETDGDAGAVKTAQGARTLRIDFEKVDLLLNLVGELVLARSRLASATERHASMPQDIAQLRRHLGAALESRTSGAAPSGRLRSTLEDLHRTERILSESYGELDSGLASLGLALGQMRDHVMKLRMIPIARLFTKYQRTVRDLSNKLGKEVRVELEGAETELDKVLVERLDDPLLHLVRNAIDHGIEPPLERARAGKPRIGTLRLAARQRGGSIVVSIRDDGAGMDPAKLRERAVEKGIVDASEASTMSDREAFDLIFQPGFSTAAVVSDVSGRGVGMDVVRDAIARLKGTIVIESQKGLGSTVELRLPLTLAITQILAVRVGSESIAIPLDAVIAAQAVSAQDLEVVAGGSALRLNERLIPVVDLARLLGLESTSEVAHDGAAAYVVVVEAGGEPYGLLVQQLLGRHEVVIKSLGALLAGAPFAAGATLIDDRVLIALDLLAVASAARSGDLARAASLEPRHAPKAAARGQHVLVAEDSDTVREAIRRAFEARGFEVSVAADGAQAIALAKTTRFDAISTDIMMPEVDGYALIRALRADPRHRSAAIVVVSSKDERIDELRGTDAGADAYLTKPVDAGDLVRQVEALLARPRPPG